MAKMKKAQTGKNVPKGMVESEMRPGKMIPKSKSNYENGNYTKMLEDNRKRKATLNKAAKKTAKQAASEISKSPAKTKMKNGGMLSAPKKDGLSMQLGYYQNVIGKNTKGKATKAVGLTKAKYGKTMMKSGGKCKNGC
jgi:hypothetical protein